VAFEFNGKQHYEAGGRFTKEEVAAQKKRDELKRQICRQQGIRLVVVHAEDLTLKGMLKKLEEVGDLLPRRSLRLYKRTIRYLDACGRRYQEAALKHEAAMKEGVTTVTTTEAMRRRALRKEAICA